MKGKHCLSPESYNIVALEKESVMMALQVAKDLLQDSDWAKGSFAIDRNSNECSELSSSARGFSLGGAVVRAVYDLQMFHLIADMSLAVTAEVIGDQLYPNGSGKVDLNEFNDSLAENKDEIISVLQKSIDYAEAMTR